MYLAMYGCGQSDAGEHLCLDGRFCNTGVARWSGLSSCRHVPKQPLAPVWKQVDINELPQSKGPSTEYLFQLGVFQARYFKLSSTLRTACLQPARTRKSLHVQDADIYLLDDILAAVDASVASWLLQNVICGPLLSTKTRLLCTHSHACTVAADVLVQMSQGRASTVRRQEAIMEGSSFASEVHLLPQPPYPAELYPI